MLTLPKNTCFGGQDTFYPLLKRTMKHIFTFALITATSFLAACSKDNDPIAEYAGQASVTFDAKVGGEDFSLGKAFTIEGKTYTFTQLRYWVSNISFTNEKGEIYKVPASYYLIEENSKINTQDGAYEYPARKRETISLSNIPAGNYKSITFSIGVDSVYNKNMSLQAGELSQLNGMTNISWMWHTSYIFSSLKGSMTADGATKNIIVETGLNTNYRTLTVDFTAPVRISTAKTTAVNFTVDVEKIIDGVDLTATPVIGAGQPAAMTRVADNYKQGAIVLQTASSK